MVFLVFRSFLIFFVYLSGNFLMPYPPDLRRSNGDISAFLCLGTDWTHVVKDLSRDNNL